MTEEVKTCECKEKAKKFLFISGAVFVGATLAILVSAAILKPKCPPPPMGMMPPRPGFERQLPPPAVMDRYCAPEFQGKRCPCRCHKHFKEGMKPQDFNFPEKPENVK